MHLFPYVVNQHMQVAEGYAKIVKAYELNPSNALALVCLSEYYFFNDDLETVCTLQSV